MKRLLILFAVLAFALSGSLQAQSTLRRTSNDLDVDVWTDKDDGSNYYEGDDITIYFRASSDCYVTVYDLDTRGNVNLIFPPDPGTTNFVHGDEIYMIPERDEDYTLSVDGPPGHEQIVAAASADYIPVPDWRGPMSVYDDRWGFKYDNDDDEFIKNVNQKYFHGEDCAFDNATFYVAPKYYYSPSKVDCTNDCGRVYIDYPNGCDVYVDGVFYGIAPLYLPGIYLGRHRVTVYWSSSIVYNDWIFVSAYDPFFIYTRPHYMYRYCYDHWYRNYVWDSYYSGPSRYKYKSSDFYTYSKPQARRGYVVVDNDHGGYKKSPTYASEKVARITKYKETSGYDYTKKTYTTGKYGAEGTRGKNGEIESKPMGREKKTDNRVGEYYERKRAGNPQTGEKGTEGKSTGGFTIKKRSDGEQKGGSQNGPVYGPEKKSNSGGTVESKPRSNEGKSTPSQPTVKQRSGDSGGKSAPASKPSSNSGGKSSNGGGKKRK